MSKDPGTEELESAFRATQETFDGEHPAPERALHHALAHHTRHTGSRRRMYWMVLPAAAVFVAGTAFAARGGALGVLGEFVRQAWHADSSRDEAGHPNGSAGTTGGTAQPKDNIPPKAGEATAAAVPDMEPAKVPPAVLSAHSSPSTSVAAASAKHEATDPHGALFEEANQLHFGAKDPARALAAWDRYIQSATTGRFLPEARYNRVVCLLRLGRHAEARAALAPFASGAYGSYRQAEAKALLDALGDRPDAAE